MYSFMRIHIYFFIIILYINSYEYVIQSNSNHMYIYFLANFNITYPTTQKFNETTDDFLPCSNSASNNTPYSLIATNDLLIRDS